MTVEQSDVKRAVYKLNTNEGSVSTVKSKFSDEYDVPYSEVHGSKVHGTGNSHNRMYTRTSGSECLVVCVHVPEE